MVTTTTQDTELTQEQREQLRKFDLLLAQIESYLAYLRRGREDSSPTAIGSS